MSPARILRVLLTLALVLGAYLPARAAQPLRILAGTTLLEDIVADLGDQKGGGVATRTLIPGSACPGHSDLRASDVTFAQGATAILLHDWQRGMPLAQALLRSSPGAQARLRIVGAPGNWMVPERQAEATEALARALAEISPDRAKGVQTRAQARRARIAALSERIKAQAARAGLPGTKVVCDVMQRPLLEWLGCVVVAEYGRFEGMTPKQLGAVMAQAKAGRAVLVVDNMQSTGGSGKALADDLGAAHVVLTNFPGVDAGSATWEQALEWNCARLIAALPGRK